MKVQIEHALVTGASRGIGRVIACDLAAGGTHVVLSARDSDQLEEAASEIRNAGGRATVAPADVTLTEDRDRLLAAAQQIAPVDVLVNNAGVEFPVALIDQSPDEIESQIRLNLTAVVQLTRAVLPGMLERGRGRIVNVSSMAGKVPVPFSSVYAASKHALNGFTASLRAELRGTGVHAGVVCPGFVSETGLWAGIGIKAPLVMREVSPRSVAAAVRRVIRGAPEVLVPPGPARPFVVLGELFPRAAEALARASGIQAKLEERARITLSRRNG